MLNNQRSYGVEIEFTESTSTKRYKLLRKLRNEGLNVSLGGYHHSAPAGAWKIERDSSCGSEVVSPILKGEQGLEELRKVLEVMNEMDLTVDINCGLHIHHDASDLNLKSFKILTKYYVKYENVFDSLVPRSRRENNNHYSRTMIINNKEQTFEYIDQQNTLQALRDLYNFDRYHKINLEAYLDHGTIEFRQHSGTMNFEKISNWIKLTQAVVERSLRPNTFITLRGNKNLDSVLNLKELKGQRKVKSYLRKRQEYLNESYRQRSQAM
ncbi:MAG TPA: amidoligase family protein [Clostridia bacterium]|nr:amidoligase family protein [Clostridia bacterium]